MLIASCYRSLTEPAAQTLATIFSSGADLSIFMLHWFNQFGIVDLNKQAKIMNGIHFPTLEFPPKALVRKRNDEVSLRWVPHQIRRINSR